MPSGYSLVDWIKPSRNEAITRIRTNGLALVVLFIVTNLAPIPSLWSAFQVVSTRAEVGVFWWLLCVIGEATKLYSTSATLHILNFHFLQ